MIIPFDLAMINSIRINSPAVKRRAATLGTRRTYKQEAQAAVYLRAIECMDLTTLSGSDTPGKIERLSAKAKRPVEPEILRTLGLTDYYPKVGAVCVYHDGVETAVRSLKGSDIPVAAVATGFPAGKISHDLKLNTIERAISAGAGEIDIVISRSHVLCGKWRELYGEILDFRLACGERARLKTIVGAGDLGTYENIAKASWCAMMAGADFIKTSTGMEVTNAILEVGLTMVRQIREFYFEIGRMVGFKPAGGIKEAKDALLWFILMKEEIADIDPRWLTPELFRLGASSLLNDLEMQLEHCATGKYSASYYHPLA